LKIELILKLFSVVSSWVEGRGGR